MLAQLTSGENGFWSVSSDTLSELATQIASRFSFTVDQAKG